MSKAIACILLLFISPAAYAATSHDVGGSGNWNTGVNLAGWASGQKFVVGDSLVFTYDPSHAVDEVNAADYTACNTGNAISSDSNSPTTVPLTASGTRYFICPRSNHCAQGMKLSVTVTAAGSPSPPSAGTPPAGGGTPPGTPTTQSSPPPPAGGSAAAALGGKTSFAGGLLLVLSAVFMG